MKEKQTLYIRKMFHWQWQYEIKVQVKESAFRQVKQLSLTRLFNAECLGFPRSREEERALCLPKEQGRVCTLPCLREGSFTLQDGAHFWSLHPPPALNISSPISGMFAISQNSFMPDFIYLFRR
ncbi:hypothetical protein T12_14739 [Trichinella patagoniensis]|uniref:Uncharacterized protein n=1 Tax=Trichinella patagoniensis TaxID=990121 RepID=A0A0V0ZII6_9BILA|nr:hypothetical protein T12_14739 [Trichinella patagoniensis]